MTDPAPVQIIGASVPRSGHHFLIRILSRSLGRRLRYCEAYSTEGCCGAFPCQRTEGASVVFRKSHDRQGEVPRDLAGVLYVVQYRHPVPQALSDRELNLVDTLGKPGRVMRESVEFHMLWLARQALYVRGFHDRWFGPGAPAAMHRLPYETLQAEPASAVAALLAAAGVEVRPRRLAAAVEEASPRRASAPPGAPRAYAPRRIEESTGFDPALHGAYEDWLLPRVPGFGYERMLPAGRVEGHPLLGLILFLERPDALREAAALAPGHPELETALARAEAAAGQPRAALDRLVALAERAPYWDRLWPTLFDVARTLGEAVRPELLGPAAVSALASSPATLVRAAEALAAGHRPMEALAAAAFALALAEEADRATRAAALRAMAAAHTALRAPERAAAALAEAARLEPEQASG
jgi:hypothetical protein